MTLELKMLINELCNAQYQAGVFWASGLPLKTVNRFDIETVNHEIKKLWKEIETLTEAKK